MTPDPAMPKGRKSSLLAPTKNASWGDSRDRPGPGPPQPQTAPARHLGAGKKPTPCPLAPPSAFKEPPPQLGCEPVPGGKLASDSTRAHCSCPGMPLLWLPQLKVHCMVASAVRSPLKTGFHWDVRSQAASQEEPTCCPHVARGCELLGTDCSFPGVDVTKAIPGDIPCTSAHSFPLPPPTSHLGTASNLSHPLPASRQFANHFIPPTPVEK